MPNMNGTGPNGQGAMTGRGMGPCAQGYTNQTGRGQGMGRGLGRGNGRGMGWNCQARPYMPSKDEYTKDLKDELKALKDEIADLEKTD